MTRLITALRVFWATLTGRSDAATRILIDASPSPSPSSTAVGDEPATVNRDQATRDEQQVPAPRPHVRNDAITLLATLQREARLVDLVQENLDAYGDAQVGVAARDVLRDCRTVLQRLFDLRPILNEDEGTELAAPEPLDIGRVQLLGNVESAPPHRGKLVHHGWQAARIELPQWTGQPTNSHVIAQAQIEVR